jgi:hypothetical protein
MSKLNLDLSQRLDITCRKGDTFKMQLLVKDSNNVPVNVSGSIYSYKLEVRETDTSPTPIIPASGFIFNGDASGNLTIEASATTMNVDSGLYVYDLQTTIIASGFVQTWFYGLFNIHEDVSVTS